MIVHVLLEEVERLERGIVRYAEICGAAEGRLAKSVEALSWIQQTIHRAYAHKDLPEICPMNTCAYALKVIRELRGQEEG